MQSKATTVQKYLAELPPDRRACIEAVRKVILKSLDKDYEEGMQYGMIGYYVPHRVYPAGYHCDPKQPLPFAHLASQKNHMSLYLMCAYGDEKLTAWFRDAWAKSGKKLDDVALDVVGDLIRRVPAKTYIARWTALLDERVKPRAEKKKAAARARAATTRAKAKAARG